MKSFHLNKPPFLIAEIGINHNGSMNLAKKLIILAKEKKFDAVKIQKREPDICVPEYQKNILYRIGKMVRSRIYNYVNKNNNKTYKTFDIVGCSPEFVKEHLEKQFIEGMTWENQGKWHIDHIIPLSSAKTEEEVYKLCHYTNLQPLWAEDNLRKSNKILI